MRWLGVSAIAVALVIAQPAVSAAARCFPEDFMFGSATASYQVEGAWNETGRTPSIWDDFCREKPDLECANVADDFLHRYKDDIALMVSTGLNSFRFSISWSRAMNWDPKTKKMVRNQAGLDFYHALIDEIRANGIVPILTLYHWDLPRELHTELSPSGWLNRGIVDHFVAYSDLIYHEFGSKVDYWTTFNEPLSFTSQGYGKGTHAPGFTGSASNAYTAAHNVLISHAYSVKLFRDLQAKNIFRSKARISIVLNADNNLPLNASDPKDVAAAERRIEFGFGWFLKPIVSGDYPVVMRERAGVNLPKFTTEEAELLIGSYDLFMLNHYSTRLATDCDSETSTIKCSDLSLGWERDMGIDEAELPPGARPSAKDKAGKINCPWFSAYPPGYMQMIQWMHRHDPQADILLTENGFCGNEDIENEDQLWYFQTYLDQVYKAVTEEKIPIIGYTAWSFVDNYEWGSFHPRFGLHYVNFTSQTGSKEGYTPKPTDLARVPRLAARWFSNVAKTKCLGSNDAQFTSSLEQLQSRSSLWGESMLSAYSIGLIAVVLVLITFRPRKYLRGSVANETYPLLSVNEV